MSIEEENRVLSRRKRSVPQHITTANTCGHILLDIEGTTTSISFVHDVLFPYVKSRLETYLKSNWNTKECVEDIEALRIQSKADYKDVVNGQKSHVISESTENEDHCRQQVIDYVIALMERDKKVTALKQLQGHIWRSGYNSGELKGHIYPDVVPALKRWHKDGKKVFIYSSGSIEAQKLLFGCSEEGNLLSYLAGHYDTSTGSKLEKESYTKISEDIGVAPSDCLFLTDNVSEARAASMAGMRVLVSKRPGNKALSEEDINEFTIIDTFDEVETQQDFVEPSPKKTPKE